MGLLFFFNNSVGTAWDFAVVFDIGLVIVILPTGLRSYLQDYGFHEALLWENGGEFPLIV